jgi:hypothetical protein
MLDDLDRSLRTLLVQELPRVAEKVEPDGFDIRFDVPNREFNSRLAKPTLCLYLYNIQENRDLRGWNWEVTRGNGSAEIRRPPVRLDCTYMITAWSSEVEDEHRLLAGAARALFRNPVLPQEILQGGLANDFEITTEVAQPETFKDIVDIWSVLDNDLRPSVRVTVTVPLDVDVAYETPLARERDMRLEGPDWTAPDTKVTSMTARLVRDGRPVAGARIRAGISSTTTDKNGEFSLRQVKPGRQTVFVLADGQFHQFEADLPGEGVVELPKPSTESEPAGSKGNDAGGGQRRRRPKKKE